ncbi:MAG TPA: sugar phosphate isomerase/epimerase family protein [Panacibacter sp.]|nr:sugar phosphate isomerase/epimerase family protein [Panacibacter sp.]
MQRIASRRRFLKNTALASLAFTTSSFEFKKYQPNLSFSTLGCPDWTFDGIIKFAAGNGFSGIEIRGIQRQLDLSQCPEFSTKANIATTKKKIADNGLHIVNLGSSASMHLPDGADRDKSIDEARRFIDLANEINCPYIRVFPNNLPKDVDKNITIEQISKGLRTLGDYAKGSSVTVLMETHGDLVHVDDIIAVMNYTQHSGVALVWDIVNMWSVTKEPVADVYARLKNYVRHTHIKDLRVLDGKDKYMLLGEGETPIFEAIDLLAKEKYNGYFSFEWEKLWHPEIDAPEIAIADYSKKMKAHFAVS